jgi:hypothetical protein
MATPRKDIRQITIDTIEAYLKRKGIGARDFGAQHMNDPYFVYALRKGSKDFRLSTIQKAWDAVS